ncbi:DUF2089 family protein [Iocasia frigidifontis]|uniref:DUF2089 family protein n=1 Tax=Iocasia fonsfrigidae TaxID=2682810 RepID=A0A8A7KI61_9FIRM|nr:MULTISPECIES: DUF2089 domain-containing protein [Halanaerobiaceae]AZO94631.1 DUF2089 domain-containing protein [Halocella sp. SP3-1]QTL97562.1 DUF2089 family protein [Iocasia fonsfrigidae]
MDYKVIGSCPVCNHELKVTEISCNKCRTIIRGEFELSKFCKLDKEQQYFIEVFIKNRGNIKEMEKELGISYPTVRNKLEEVRKSLGFVGQEKPAVNKKEILDKLSKGEISKDKALKLLTE